MRTGLELARNWSEVGILLQWKIEYIVVMDEAIQEYLGRKGGVGVLAVLVEHGKTFTEIETETEITSSTVKERRNEAVEIGLIEPTVAKRESGTVTEHRLTDAGTLLAQEMLRNGVVSNYRSMRMHQRELNKKTDKLIEWVSQNSELLQQLTDADEETVIDHRDDSESEAGWPDEIWGSPVTAEDLDEAEHNEE